MGQPSVLEKLIFYNKIGVKLPISFLSEEEISYLDSLEEVVQEGGYYLKSFDVKSYDLRAELIEKILKKVWLFERLPFVRQVALCNSLTLGNADENSDIDLFIVVDQERFFMARFIVTLVFQLLGIRRYGGNVEGRFCLSFWVSDQFLDMKELMIEDDYYFDFWLNNLWWIFDDVEFWNEFRLVNKDILWRDYFISLLGLKKKSGLIEWLLGGLFGSLLEQIVGFYQMKRAKRKFDKKNSPKGVVLKRGIFKCHDQDVRWAFRDDFNKILQRF